MKIKNIILMLFSLLVSQSVSYGQGFHFDPPKDPRDLSRINNIIGSITLHTVQPNETLLDIARAHGLGFNEIEDLYPNIDPWVPPVGTELVMPTRWILPLVDPFGIVINVAEMRLYYFRKDKAVVETYPIGIGDLGSETPVGSYKIVQKRKNPYWYVPKSLWNETAERVVPPGPENPLGDYWLGLSLEAYGIHGTNFPWAIGRLVTLGCIRLYPEHIKILFDNVSIGTGVRMIYEPVKIGFSRGHIYAEAHSDRYSKSKNLVNETIMRLSVLGVKNYVDVSRLQEIIYAHDGLPHRIGTIRDLTSYKKGGER